MEHFKKYIKENNVKVFGIMSIRCDKVRSKSSRFVPSGPYDVEPDIDTDILFDECIIKISLSPNTDKVKAFKALVKDLDTLNNIAEPLKLSPIGIDSSTLISNTTIELYFSVINKEGLSRQEMIEASADLVDKISYYLFRKDD